MYCQEGFKQIRIMFGITLSEIGGAQKVLFDIISSLPEERYDITLVTSPGGQLIEWINKLNEEKSTHIKIITLQCLKRELSFISDIKAFYSLYKIIRSGNYDIVHFHSSKMGILGPYASWLAGVPNIYFTVHGWGVNEYMPFLYRKMLGFAERIAGKLCTRVICVSEHDME